MSFTISSPVTGGDVTEYLTSPTYTLTETTGVNQNARSFLVTALGGTQTGVDTNSVSKPFTVSIFRPASSRALPSANASTGIVPNVPNNNYKVVFRKGAEVNANNSPETAVVTVNIKVPAGSDSYEPEQLAALCSLVGGFFNTHAGEMTDLLTEGDL